jgi:DnaK suppressor protein
MDELSEEQRREISRALELALQEADASIVAFREMSAPVSPENAIGRVSRMDAIQNKSVVEAALRKAEEKKEALLQMQKRLGDQDFGLCRRCGRPIPVKRLILMPQSPHCVRCAQ